MVKLIKIKEVFCNLAIKAGKAIEDIRATNYQTQTKSDFSPVTEADFAANKIICDGLSQSFPEIPIVSEEGAQNFAQNLETGYFFLIDPLDGTRDFIDNGIEYTVNIALIHNALPIAGVVYAPASGLFYYGDIESGAVFANIENWEIGETHPIKAQKANAPMRIMVSRKHLDTKTRDFALSISGAITLPLGSSLKLCKIACGEGDLYPRFGPTSQWDIGAGQAVLMAAGGKILVETGDFLKYGEKNADGTLKLNPNFIACGDFDPPKFK